jgi:hypothetical protein
MQIQAATTKSVKICPAPTPVFTGHEDKIQQVARCILRGDKERCVFVVHGFGGAGKTQIVLKTIESTLDMWTDIIYVDATSRETVISALEGFAKAKEIGSEYDDTIHWLRSHRERWLMVFDNADDPTLGVSEFFPLGNRGSILITTRISNLGQLTRGPESDCSVSIMHREEALELLLKTAHINGDLMIDTERDAAVRLLEVHFCMIVPSYRALTDHECNRILDI